MKFFYEIKRTLSLGLPIILGGLGSMLMTAVDVAMIGRLTAQDLSAVSLGHNIFAIAMLFGFGLCVPIQIETSVLYGAKRLDESFEIFKLGIFIQTIFSVILMVLFFGGYDALYLLGQEKTVIDKMILYLRWIVISSIPLFIWSICRSYSEGMQKTWMPFVVLMIAVLANIPLNYIFIYGGFGIPEMGVEGAGIATFIARFIGMITIIIIFWKDNTRRPNWTIKNIFIINHIELKRILKIGIPASFQIVCDASFFIFAAIIIGWFGAIELSAHQIAITVAGMAFMVPLGVGQATTIRIGEMIGNGNLIRIKSIANSSILFSGIFMMGYAILITVFGDFVSSFFTNISEIKEYAISLFFVAAIFAISDGIQTTLQGILRGLYDIKIPTAILLIAYWMCSTSVSLFLAFGEKNKLFATYSIPFGLDLGAKGIWISFTVALFLVALILWFRFKYVHNRFLRLRNYQSISKTSLSKK